MLSNSLKYAFPDDRSGAIRIVMREDSAQQITLLVADDGIGLNSDLDWTTTPTLGLRLVRTLAQQLGARLEVNSKGGTEVQLTFTTAAA